MNANDFDVRALLKMRHSPIHNYVVPGLTSWLIGNPSPAGTIRLFENQRDQQEAVVPHSHRFDFQCWVLSGFVRNRIWRWASVFATDVDLFRPSLIRYQGAPGKYEIEHREPAKYSYTDDIYSTEDCYSMEAKEIHSIYFSRGAKVLFFEGPQISNESVILEPVVDGMAIPLFRTEPWMFRRDPA